MVDVIIFYEIIQREYENALLLKHELERRGYSVKIYNSINSDYYKSWFTRCKVAVIHTIRRDFQVSYYTKCIFGKPKALVDMQYEQIFLENMKESIRTIPIQKARNAYHVCWGEDAVERLKKIDIPDEKIWPVGAIQFDILNPKYKNYYKSKQEICDEFDLDFNKRIILFNSSFVYATYTLEKIRKIAIELKMSYLERFYLNQVKAQKMIVEWIEVFLKKYTDIIFIYRPHPGEEISSSVQNLKDRYSNFYIIGEYSVRQWIQIADVVNVWDSTTVMEAIYANKKCNILYPFEIPKEDKIVYLDKAKCITTVDEFCKENTSFEFVNPLNEDVMKRYYYDKRNEVVHSELCDRIEKLIQSKEKEDYKVKFNLQYLKHEGYYFGRTLILDLLNWIRKIFKISCTEKKLKHMYLGSLYDKSYMKKTYEEPLYKVLENFGGINER